MRFFRERLSSSAAVISFNDEMLREKRDFTGVMEVFDINDTISLMLKLHPQLGAIVNDNTTTGHRKGMRYSNSDKFKDEASFEYLDNLTTKELSERATTLPNDSLILEMTFNVDRTGKILTYEDTSHRGQAHSNLWIVGFPYGIWCCRGKDAHGLSLGGRLL